MGLALLAAILVGAAVGGALRARSSSVHRGAIARSEDDTRTGTHAGFSSSQRFP